MEAPSLQMRTDAVTLKKNPTVPLKVKENDQVTQQFPSYLLRRYENIKTHRSTFIAVLLTTHVAINRQMEACHVVNLYHGIHCWQFKKQSTLAVSVAWSNPSEEVWTYPLTSHTVLYESKPMLPSIKKEYNSKKSFHLKTESEVLVRATIQMNLKNMMFNERNQTRRPEVV